MKLHPNAKTTPAARGLLIRRILEEHWTVRGAAEAAGVSVRTAYKGALVKGPRLPAWPGVGLSCQGRSEMVC